MSHTRLAPLLFVSHSAYPGDPVHTLRLFHSALTSSGYMFLTSTMTPTLAHLNLFHSQAYHTTQFFHCFIGVRCFTKSLTASELECAAYNPRSDFREYVNSMFNLEIT